MGSQEVLGQAARLASSGLLLQVLFARLAPGRPAAGIRGEPAWGGLSPSVDSAREGFYNRRRLPRRGDSRSWSWEPAFRVPAGRLQTSHFPFKNYSSYMAVGES